MKMIWISGRLKQQIDSTLFMIEKQKRELMKGVLMDSFTHGLRKREIKMATMACFTLCRNPHCSKQPLQKIGARRPLCALTVANASTDVHCSGRGQNARKEEDSVPKDAKVELKKKVMRTKKKRIFSQKQNRIVSMNLKNTNKTLAKCTIAQLIATTTTVILIARRGMIRRRKTSRLKICHVTKINLLKIAKVVVSKNAQKSTSRTLRQILSLVNIARQYSVKIAPLVRASTNNAATEKIQIHNA